MNTNENKLNLESHSVDNEKKLSQKQSVSLFSFNIKEKEKKGSIKVN